LELSLVNDFIKDITRTSCAVLICVAHGLGETTKSGVDHSRWHVGTLAHMDTHGQEALAADASRCKQMQADASRCTQMQADARIVPAVPAVPAVPGKETDVVV